ncbi:MAG: EAL domain-containing protein [Ruminococcaceae bacterium]|nr:EAL domain-containing protein [Oscillospiraceae bacterium]
MNPTLPAGGLSALYDSLLAAFEQPIGTFMFIWDLVADEYHISPYAMDRYTIPDVHLTNVHENWVGNVFPTDRDTVSALFLQLRQGQIDHFEHDYRMLSRSSEPFWVTTRARLLRGETGAPALLVGGVTEMDSGHEIDPVTGLPDIRQLSDGFAGITSQGQRGYFMLLRLNSFEKINDLFGHRTSDALLQTFAALLKKHAPAGRAFRLTGDRFAAVLPETSMAAAQQFYQRLAQDFAEIQQALGHPEVCTLSAGATAWPDDGAQLGQLLQCADTALTSAKHSGKGRLVYFSRQQYAEYLTQVAVREEVKRCVEDGFTGFSLHYQPLVSAKTGLVEGAEALLRWHSEKHGRLPPATLIPMLQELGLLAQVGIWTLDKALAQCRRWRKHLPNFRVDINISPTQLDNALPGQVLALLRRYGLPASALTLELTGDTTGDLHRWQPIFDGLRRIGVWLALDDLGAGFSRLGSLLALGIHRLKIDRHFAPRLAETDLDYRLTRFIIESAHSIGVQVTIEGVESEAAAWRILTLAPDTLQGYYFSRPVAAATFGKKLAGAWRSIGPVHRQRIQTITARQYTAGVSTDFIGTESRKALLDELAEIVMVSDIDSCEVLYLNRAGRAFYNVKDYTGLLCHKVVFGHDHPCPDCLSHQLDSQVFNSFEYTSRLMGGRFQVRAQQLHWNGHNAGLTIVQPPDNPKAAAATRQLKVEKAIVASALALANGTTIEEALNAVLGEIGHFYQADRSYIFELDEKGRTTNNTYEWCARAIAPEIIHYQAVNLKKNAPVWLESLKTGAPIVLESPARLRALYPNELSLLVRPNVTHSITVPFFYNDRLAGYIGVDNPRTAKTDPTLLVTLRYFIANEINKRRMTAQLHHLSYVDALTGMYNRNRYLQALSAHRPQPGVSTGIVFVDINGLKQINDTEGHTQGDALIRRVAGDLQNCFAHYPVYRIGGDEFVAICDGMEPAPLDDAVLCLRDSAARHGYSVSIGRAWSSGGTPLEDMARQADEAMYAEKRRYYSSGHNRRARRPTSLE